MLNAEYLFNPSTKYFKIWYIYYFYLDVWVCKNWWYAIFSFKSYQFLSPWKGSHNLVGPIVWQGTNRPNFYWTYRLKNSVLQPFLWFSVPLKFLKIWRHSYLPKNDSRQSRESVNLVLCGTLNTFSRHHYVPRHAGWEPPL